MSLQLSLQKIYYEAIRLFIKVLRTTYSKVEDGETWIANSHDTEDVLKLTSPVTVLDNSVIGVTAVSDPTDMFHFLDFNVDTASSKSTRVLELGGSGKLSIHNKGLEVF
jgi:hypothetical protein